jgi:Mrp family chromosome partitioning ATPase/capsular polysaccharide biosynthesis protein
VQHLNLTSDGLERPELSASVRRYWYVCLVLVILGAGAGFGYAAQQQPVYESETQILVADPFSVGLFRDLRQPLEPRRYVFNQAELAASGRVAARAAEILDDGTSPAQLSGRITATPEWESNLIRVVVAGPTAEAAQRSAEAVAEAYEVVVREDFEGQIELQLEGIEAERLQLEQQLRTLQARVAALPEADFVLQAQLGSLTDQISNLGVRARELSVATRASQGGVAFREEAALPSRPVRPQPLRLAGAGALAGLMLGAALSYLLFARRLRLDGSHRAQRALEAPMLGEVPDFSRRVAPLPVLSAPRSVAGEAYQFLVPALDSVLPERIGGEVVLVTSATAREGKTVTALNLAIAACQDQRDVLLIDGDIRAHGLTDILSSDGAAIAPLGEVKTAVGASGEREWWAPELPTLSIRTIGPPDTDPAGYFRTSAFDRKIGEFRTLADLVIIDAPPLLAVADAAEIAETVDGVIVVTTPSTGQSELREIRRRLSLIDVPLVGYVMNRSRLKASPYAYGYASAQPPLAPTRRRAQRT